MDRNYCVYVLTNRVGSVLYIGVTNDLQRRLWEHKTHALPGFTERYQVNRLVYYESTTNISAALEREKQLKRWNRDKKEWLISMLNPHWNDLSESIQLEGFPACR